MPSPRSRTYHQLASKSQQAEGGCKQSTSNSAQHVCEVWFTQWCDGLQLLHLWSAKSSSAIIWLTALTCISFPRPWPPRPLAIFLVTSLHNSAAHIMATFGTLSLVIISKHFGLWPQSLLLPIHAPEQLWWGILVKHAGSGARQPEHGSHLLHRRGVWFQQITSQLSGSVFMEPPTKGCYDMRIKWINTFEMHRVGPSSLKQPITISFNYCCLFPLLPFYLSLTSTELFVHWPC